MLTCPGCGGELESRPVERARTVAGHAFTASLPARVCRSCGEAFFDDAIVERFDLAIAARLAEGGVDAPEALKFLRKATGLQGRELAVLLDVRPETVSRWEQGKRPVDRATFAIMRQLVWERLHARTALADYLASLRRPKRLPRRVKIDVGRAA
ncbi:MAG TPA: type II TA system antitoxin MqsA family protein [Polyangia bacterium]|jgi:putative zinc finger/helix-turn-helix YgiT family protein